MGVAVCGSARGGAAFVTVRLARCGQLYADDVHPLLPVGARRWQTKLLAMALILLPLFLRMGPVPLVFTILFACALYATTVEVVVGCALLALLAASPWVVTSIGRVAAFGGPAVDVRLLEHGTRTRATLARPPKRLPLAHEPSAGVAPV